MNRKRKIYDEVLKMFGIPHTKESPWYQDRFDKFNEIVGQEESPSPAPVDKKEPVPQNEKTVEQVNTVVAIRELEKMATAAPVSQPNVDEVVKYTQMMYEDLWAFTDRILRDKGCSNKDVHDAIYDAVKEIAPKYLFRQPEVDALKKRVEELEADNKGLHIALENAFKP